VAEAIGSRIVFVDNASADGTVELLRDRQRSHAAVEIVEMGRNAGYAAAVNAAFASLPGSDVLLVNPDVDLDGPWQIETLARFLARERTVGVVAPRLVGEDGEAQPSARRFPSLPALLGTLPAVGRVGPLRRSYERYTAPARSTLPHTVDWVIGAAMLIRRAAYDEVGGWDERFFLYIEDTDFCRRCLRSGWEVAYLPSVAMRHRYPRASRSGDSVLSSRARRHHVAGLARLFARDPRLLVGLGGTSERVFEHRGSG
jgi:GT2 family glycosyltransferase